ncbi:MAG: kynureninase [Bacteroidetes bacterium]|nr:kynureninase [Bacteroidota bacterium]MDA1121656.1 kynureninase [Bacteroidota bacterium]
MEYINSRKFAVDCDRNDPLKEFRDYFYFPKKDDKPVIYFCGNSLGLQPKKVRDFFTEEMDNWAEHGVEGHFKGKRPWVDYHKHFRESLGRLVGAKETEVVAMNSLTVNLHLLMVSFYRPTPSRFKIICEAGAFPSDRYAIESQIRFHGFDPEQALVAIEPLGGECVIKTDQILSEIKQAGDELALVLFSGVQYYSGQYFDINKIAETAHHVGAFAGFDLAHAIGNVPLSLHNWNVDFAVWCSYKYLNSGPGGVGGAFVHQKHHDQNLPQFAGWWGTNESERFEMKKEFNPMVSADRWQLSNAPVFNMAAHLASLEIFEQAGINALREKSLQLTGFLEFLLSDLHELIHIITPKSPDERGCQLSLLIDANGREIFDQLHEQNVIVDWREPNVVRAAPVPLYNTFCEVYDFVQILKSAIEK